MFRASGGVEGGCRAPPPPQHPQQVPRWQNSYGPTPSSWEDQADRPRVQTFLPKKWGLWSCPRDVNGVGSRTSAVQSCRGNRWDINVPFGLKYFCNVKPKMHRERCFLFFGEVEKGKALILTLKWMVCHVELSNYSKPKTFLTNLMFWKYYPWLVANLGFRIFKSGRKGSGPLSTITDNFCELRFASRPFQWVDWTHLWPWATNWRGVGGVGQRLVPYRILSKQS